GVTINLDDPNTVTNPDQTTVTDSNGAYSFTGLTPGITYTISEDVPNGWVCSVPDPCSYDVPTSSGNDVTGKDFANYKPVSISGTKFVDANANDIGEDDERTTATVKISLDDPTTVTNPDQPTLTDSNVCYSFPGPTPGLSPYTTLFRSNGWVCSVPDPCSYDVPTSSGNDVTGKDFANYKPVSISGTKFVDANAN